MAKVVVYKNLNLGNWSVCECKSARTYGRKIAGVDSIVLANVTFVVQPAAQRKVMAGAARTVHAWAVGERVFREPVRVQGTHREIHYNPRRSADFTLDGVPVTAAALVEFSSDGRAYAVESL
jgi:hypothetical protein